MKLYKTNRMKCIVNFHISQRFKCLLHFGLEASDPRDIDCEVSCPSST